MFSVDVVIISGLNCLQHHMVQILVPVQFQILSNKLEACFIRLLHMNMLSLFYTRKLKRICFRGILHI